MIRATRVRAKETKMADQQELVRRYNERVDTSLARLKRAAVRYRKVAVSPAGGEETRAKYMRARAALETAALRYGALMPRKKP